VLLPDIEAESTGATGSRPRRRPIL
jgi:hypothetical protein